MSESDGKSGEEMEGASMCVKESVGCYGGGGSIDGDGDEMVVVVRIDEAGVRYELMMVVTPVGCVLACMRICMQMSMCQTQCHC